MDGHYAPVHVRRAYTGARWPRSTAQALGPTCSKSECVIDITNGSQPFAAANANMRLSGWLDKYGYTISASHPHFCDGGGETASAVYIATYKLYNAIGHSVGVLKLTADEPVAPRPLPRRAHASPERHRRCSMVVGVQSSVRSRAGCVCRGLGCSRLAQR